MLRSFVSYEPPRPWVSNACARPAQNLHEVFELLCHNLGLEREINLPKIEAIRPSCSWARSGCLPRAVAGSLAIALESEGDRGEDRIRMIGIYASGPSMVLKKLEAHIRGNYRYRATDRMIVSKLKA